MRRNKKGKIHIKATSKNQKMKSVTIKNTKVLYDNYCNTKMIECNEELITEDSLYHDDDSFSYLIEVDASTIAFPNNISETILQTPVIVGCVILSGNKTTKSTNNRSTKEDIIIGDRIIAYGMNLTYNSLYVIIPHENIIKLSDKYNTLNSNDIACLLSTYYMPAYQCLTRIVQNNATTIDTFTNKRCDINTILVVGNKDFYNVVKQIIKSIKNNNIFPIVVKYTSKQSMNYYRSLNIDIILDTIGCNEYCPSRKFLNKESSKLIYITSSGDNNDICNDVQWNVFCNVLYNTYYYSVDIACNIKSGKGITIKEYKENINMLLNLLYCNDIQLKQPIIVNMNDIHAVHKDMIEKECLFIVCNPTLNSECRAQNNIRNNVKEMNADIINKREDEDEYECSDTKDYNDHDRLGINIENRNIITDYSSSTMKINNNSDATIKKKNKYKTPKAASTTNVNKPKNNNILPKSWHHWKFKKYNKNNNCNSKDYKNSYSASTATHGNPASNLSWTKKTKE